MMKALSLNFKKRSALGMGIIGMGIVYGYVCCISIHNSGVGAFGARPTVVESIMVNGEVANIAVPNAHPNDSHPQCMPLFDFSN